MAYLYDPETKKALDSETERAKAEEKKAVTDVSMTNEDGVYTLKQTKDGTETEIGTIETEQNNPVVEVKDSVVENNTDGYDFHTISETTSDGTSNEVGQFYVGQKQIIGEEVKNNTIYRKFVDQTGNVSEEPALSQMSYPTVHQSHGLNLFSYNNAYGKNVNILGGMLGKCNVTFDLPKQTPLTTYDAKNINFLYIGSGEWERTIKSLHAFAFIKNTDKVTNEKPLSYLGIGLLYNCTSYATKIDVKIFTLMDERTDENDLRVWMDIDELINVT